MLFKLSFVPCSYLLTIALFKHLEMRFQQFSITCTLNQRCSLSRTALSHPLLYEYIKSLCKITKIAKQFFAKISQNKSELENLVHLFFTILSKLHFKNVQKMTVLSSGHCYMFSPTGDINFSNSRLYGG